MEPEHVAKILGTACINVVASSFDRGRRGPSSFDNELPRRLPGSSAAVLKDEVGVCPVADYFIFPSPVGDRDGRQTYEGGFVDRKECSVGIDEDFVG